MFKILSNIKNNKDYTEKKNYFQNYKLFHFFPNYNLDF